jgi:hypothetical protein
VTATAQPTGVVAAHRGLAWHAPPHAIMLVVMVLAMLPGADAARAFAGAAALLGVAVALAPLVRRRAGLTPVLLDLAAMSGALVAMAASGHPGGTHGHAPSAAIVLVGVAITWAIARAAATRGRAAVITAASCAAQFAAMIVLTLV